MCLYVCPVDGVHPQDNCSYQDVLSYLNLSKNNELYTMTRPVKNYKHPTYVTLEVLLYAILDVVSGLLSKGSMFQCRLLSLLCN